MTSLKDAMRARRTAKVLCDPEAPLPATGDHRALIDDLLDAAGLAPFHFASNSAHHGEMTSPVPWRVYKFDGAACRDLLADLRDSDPPAGKILDMLAGADALLQVTWLPDPGTLAESADDLHFAGTERNMEHIAAAAAAVQSFLLLATDAGFRTYWSSGGVLRSAAVFARMGIPREQMLLGSVFLFPQNVGDAEIRPGKLRDLRGSVTDWSVWREM